MKKNARKMKGPPKSRRRGMSLLSWTLAATSAIGVQAFSSPVEQGTAPSGSGTAQDSRTLQFKIAAGPLDDALAEFQRVTGVKVTFADQRIGKVQSPGVTGSLTPGQAIQSLLSGTGVRATFLPDTIRLELQGLSEFVAVVGEPAQLESPKYREPLRDTPQTVVVIPQQVFMQQNAVSLREVLRNTPGITMSIGEGGTGGTSSGDNILIRGFAARNDIYIDGVRDPGLVSRDAFNIESVEVAKGPSSVTGGRGATGGSINLVSKSAEAENEATVRLTGGNANYGRSTVDWNRKLTDSTAVRFNGMWQNTGYPGRDVAKYRSWGAAPSLALGLGKPTRLTVNYTHLNQNNIPDWGLPTLLPDVAIAQGITVNDLKFSNFYGFASRDYEITKSDLVTAKLEHKLTDSVSVRNLVRYGKNYRDAVLTPPRPATSTAGQGPEDPGYNPLVAQIRRTDTKYQYRNDRVATNQSDLWVEAFKTGPLAHDADFGFEISRDHQPTYAFTDTFANGRPPVADLFNPDPERAYTPALAKTGATTNAHANSTAVYAFDTVKFNEHLQLDLGGRWDLVAVDYATVSATGVKALFGRTDKVSSGRAGLVYKPVERSSIYASYSTSFTPSFDGTLGLTLAATGVNSQALAPEKTRNMEAGTKWDFTRTLQFSAAVFQIEKTNAKTTDLNGATVLAGDQSVKGVEFNLSGNPTPKWGVFSGLSFMNGVVKSSGVATEVGAQLAYVPKATFNLWSTYSFLNDDLYVGVGTNYNDGHYFNQTGGFLFVSNRNDPRYVKNAAAIQALTKYWLFNAYASYKVNDHLRLQVNGSNLGNVKYADRAYDRHFLPGPTRQVLIGPVITW